VNEYKIVPHDEIIAIPPEVATCPYCGAKLWVQLDTWTQLDDGMWGVDEDETPHPDCESEPEIHEDFTDEEITRWQEWSEVHSKMPYVYQLPVEVKVAKWLNANYRFDMDATR
jgi:hypothetical protein